MAADCAGQEGALSMRLMLLMCACCLLLTGIACAQAPPSVVPSIVIMPPQQGIVTIVATYGQFYTNLSAKERLCPGAELLVIRQGVPIGRAQVLKVNMLSSIAQLLPEYRAVVPQAGDAVVVRYNPTTPEVGRLHPPRSIGMVSGNCRPPALPAIEPDMSFHDIGPFYTLAALAIIVLSLLD